MWIPGWRRAAAAAGWWLGVSVLLFMVMWPAGLLAGWLEDPVDWPVFRWSESVFPDVEPWWTLNDTITRMGNTTQTRAATVAGAIGLAVLWWRRRIRLPWLPLAVLPAVRIVTSRAVEPAPTPSPAPTAPQR